MAHRKSLAAVALASISLVAAAEDYVGGLKPPKSPDASRSFISLVSEPVPSFATPNLNGNSEGGYRLKLGYHYSRYIAVESQFVDFGRTSGDFTASPTLTSAFRSTGFGVDTIAMLPWRSFSFYGRLGAYRGESRNAFSQYSTSLTGNSSSLGTRWRYGLGMRYDFTKSLGIKAEVERYSPLGTPLEAQAETDLVSIGLSWRF